MTDLADTADRAITATTEAAVATARNRAAAMPRGEPGTCKGCGEDFTRLVDGLCGRCRDRGVRHE